MVSIARHLIRALLLAVTCSGLVATSALASRSQQSVIEDSARLLSPDPATQNASLDEIQALGAEIVKIPVPWRDIAPTSNTAGLDRPEAYPPGSWSVVDSAVQGARARGLKVWLMITAPAPAWAVAKDDTKYPGTYKPDPEAFGDFAEAVGRRYVDVDIFSIWNEPNLSRWLQPQHRRGVAVSATRYRAMYQSAYDGLVRAGRGGATILFGELLPRAIKPRETNATTPPLMWLRDFFCIDAQGKALRGSAARKHGCSGFRKIRTSGLAYHPYTPPIGPIYRETKDRADSATIFYLKRVERLLDQAYKQRRVNKRRMQIFSSEFGFQSDPPDINFTRISKIPGFLNISEYLSYKDPRVATYSQYLLVDDSDLASFQTGLRFADGSKKDDVYAAYRLPFNVFRHRGNTVVVWGCVRAAAGAGQTVEVQVKQGSDWVTANSVTVTSSPGYFEKKISVPAADSKTFRLVWNGITSRASKPVNPVKASTR